MAALLSLTFCLNPPPDQPSLVSFPKPLAYPLRCSCIIISTTLLLLRQTLLLSSFGANGSIFSLPGPPASCLLPLGHVLPSELPANPSTSLLDRRRSSASFFLFRPPSGPPARGPAPQSTSRCMVLAAASGSPLLTGDSEPPTSLLPRVLFSPRPPRLQNVLGTSLGGLIAPPSLAGSANTSLIMVPIGTPLPDHSAQPPSRLSMSLSQPCGSPRHSLDPGMLLRVTLG